MTYYLEIPVDGDDPIRVDVTAPDLDMVPAGRGRAESIGRLGESLQETMGRIRPVAEAVVNEARALPVRPQTVTAEFGVRFTADAGALIARTGGEAHLTIALTWTPTSDGAPA
ncbi:CU044_2847 family protein [Actinomadura algeriensis]|uniref:Trypsin-co-occurring domain-containing protein n=1 Tax=Actinomadura algeriensis TaxID=1679523 RepID=A0ABR9K488_9ACTN|nr:CU044_2847 family protein [Actinomadura algeriensis]MBE1537180.1 hypothetical protein [Actinomadura algeriensis]